MCFSAAASFSSSTLLGATGIAGMYRAENTSQRVFAAIPLVFALQQFTEGVLWMSLTHPSWSGWQQPATVVFQVFAQMIWPLYMPLCAWLFEKRPRQKRLLLYLGLFGVALSAYTGLGLYRYPVWAVAREHHILYTAGFALAKQWYYGVLYFVPTIVAPMVCGNRYMKWLGVSFLIAYAASRLYFHFYEISVWCFFGALISGGVFLMLGRLKQENAAAGRSTI